MWHPRNAADPDLPPLVVHALTGWQDDRPAFGNWQVIPGPAVVCGPGEEPTAAQRAWLVRGAQRDRLGPCRRRRGTAAARPACGGSVQVVRAS